MGRKLQDLTPADFPGVDTAKFEEWKNVQSSFWRAYYRSYLITAAAIFFGLIVRGGFGSLMFVVLFIGWMCYMLLYARPIRLRADALAKEMGIDRHALKRALAGQPTNQG